MTQPPRLLDVGTEFERDLLASAQDDADSEDGLHRVLAAVAIVAAVCAKESSLAGPSQVAAGATGPIEVKAPPGVDGAGLAVLTKWAGIAIALLVVGGGAVAFSMTSMRGRPSTRIAPPQPALAEGPGLSISPSANAPAPASPTLVTTPAAMIAGPQTQPSAAAVTAPGFVAPRSSPPHTTSALSSPPAVLSSMAAELAFLGRVRASLAGGHRSEALKELDAYDRAFPTSTLAEEAAVLRVDALTAEGHQAAAAAVARRLLAADPTSAHAPHLLEVLRANENL